MFISFVHVVFNVCRLLQTHVFNSCFHSFSFTGVYFNYHGNIFYYWVMTSQTEKITLRKRLFSYIVFHLQFISQKFWILLCLKQGNVKAANCWYYIKIFLIASVTPHHINQLLLAFTGKHKVVCMVICLKGHSKPAYSLVSIWFYQRFISGQSFRRIMTQSRRCLCATVFNTFSLVHFLSFY